MTSELTVNTSMSAVPDDLRSMVDSLATKLQRRDIKDSLQIALATLEVVRRVIQAAKYVIVLMQCTFINRYRDIFSLMNILKEVGKILSEACPIGR